MMPLRPMSNFVWARAAAGWGAVRRGAGWVTEARRLAALSILVAITSLCATVYFNFFWHPESLRVYFRLPDPGEIGSNHLRANFFFINSGKEASLIEDIWLIAVAANSPARASGSELSLCKNPFLYTPDFLALLPPNLPRRVQEQNGTVSSYLVPTSLYVDGTQTSFPSIAVEGGKMRFVSAVFEPEAMEWTTYNAVVLCPLIRFFDRQGMPRSAICEGYEQSMVSGGGILRAPGASPAQLLPTPSTACLVR
jgi:hypothetical protein